FVVVLAGGELAAAGVALAWFARAAGQQVVVHAAAGAQPPGQHPAADLAVRHVEVDNPVDVVALQEEQRLPPVAREPVDDEAVVPVVLGQPAPHHRLGHVVPDQVAFGHDPLDLGPHLGVVLHVPAEDVPHADVHEIEVTGQQLALRALTAALHAHDHVFAHGSTLAQAAGLVKRAGRVTAPARRRYAQSMTKARTWWTTWNFLVAPRWLAWHAFAV